VEAVILNYNSSTDTIKLLSSLIKMGELVTRIVIVDNNSGEDDKKALLNFTEAINKNNKKIQEVKLIFNNKNNGYAAGNNIGLRYLMKNKSKDNLISIINPDIYIAKEQLNGLLNNYQKAEKKYGENSIGIISPWMINHGASGMVAWKMPHFLSDLISASVVLKKLFGDILSYKKIKRNTGVLEVGVLPGSFLLINKKAIETTGFLEEETFLYCEERILAARMKRHNFNILLDTDHYYDHEHSKTINKFLSGVKKIDYLYDSKKVYYTKEKNSKFQASFISSLRVLSKIEYVALHSFRKLIKNKF